MSRIASGPIFAVCACAVLLTSCSSDKQKTQATDTIHEEGRPAEPASSSPAPPADKRPLIIAFGDSLTSGVVEHTYPEYLQDLLDKDGFHFRVDNQGVAGDTTADGLARIDNVTAEKPAIVLLEFGGNDGLRGLPVETTKQNLAAMIEKLKTPHTQVLLLGITLPPNYGAEYIKSFDAMYTDLARQYQLPLFPFLLLHVYNHKDLMQPDGIHPDSAGNKIVAEDVYRFMLPQLERLRRQ